MTLSYTDNFELTLTGTSNYTVRENLYIPKIADTVDLIDAAVTLSATADFTYNRLLKNSSASRDIEYDRYERQRVAVVVTITGGGASLENEELITIPANTDLYPDTIYLNDSVTRSLSTNYLQGDGYLTTRVSAAGAIKSEGDESGTRPWGVWRSAVDSVLNASGTVTLSATVAVPDQQAPEIGVIYDMNGNQFLVNQSFSLAGIPDGDPVGEVLTIDGTGYVTRADGGVVVPLVEGTLIYRGDIVESSDGTEMNLGFVDSTEIPVFGSTSLQIDEYVYDDSPPETGNFSPLRGFFLFVSDLLPDSPQEQEWCICGTGIRGAADDIVKEELLNNPNSDLYGNVGIWIEHASPVILSTLIAVPNNAFTIAFDFALFDLAQSLTVYLAGVELISFNGTDVDLQTLQHFEMVVDWEATIAELTFVFDGPTGVNGLLTGLEFPGYDPLDFNNWYGSGSAEFVWVTDQERYDLLISDAEYRLSMVSVPEPATFTLFATGLVGIGFAARRRRKAA